MWGDVQHRLGIEVDLEGSKMTPPDRLADTLKAISAVCDLTKSPVISPNALFYLAQLRESLEREVERLEQMKRDKQLPKAA